MHVDQLENSTGNYVCEPIGKEYRELCMKNNWKIAQGILYEDQSENSTVHDTFRPGSVSHWKNLLTTKVLPIKDKEKKKT